jgi:predicted FMN-binding regulatory protein PaiB
VYQPTHGYFREDRLDVHHGLMRTHPFGAMVGVEIEITRIEGKWKVSQNQPEASRDGVVRGLRMRGDERARVMAGLVSAAGHAAER